MTTTVNHFYCKIYKFLNLLLKDNFTEHKIIFEIETLSSLTCGFSLRHSKNEVKKSNRLMCLGATHRVSISAPTAKVR